MALLPVLAYCMFSTSHTAAVCDTTLFPKADVRDNGFASHNVEDLAERTLGILWMILRRSAREMSLCLDWAIDTISSLDH